MYKFFLTLLLYTCSLFVWGQDTKFWHWKDLEKDGVHGVSLFKAQQLLADLKLKPTPIIIAVLDGGIDTTHPQIKPILWRNPKEIPGNALDDDKNGFVDDLHGWNFLGNAAGENINKASDEKSRVYHRYKNEFKQDKLDSTSWDLTKKQAYKIWQQAAAEIVFTDEDADNLSFIKMARNAVVKMGVILIREIEDSNFTTEQLETYQPIGKLTADTKISYLRTMQALGIDRLAGHHSIVEDLNEYISGKEQSAVSIDTPPEDLRKKITKDQYVNFNDQYYGNNDITGPNAKHGTHVAGLAAGIVDTNFTKSNFNNPIQIMGLRVVPDGDEYDKDVALGIRYAVNNGAKIINMSFGKSYSPEQPWVDSAIRYAASKDVLIIHSAGNESYDLNSKSVYPSPYSNVFKDRANNMMTVGASNDPVIAESILTDFSNFGNQVVDLLSPGNKIYSSLPNQQYGFLNGTSMSAPVLSHIAALVRAYFPKLSATQVKSILLQSCWKPSDENMLFPIPKKDQSKKLNEISAEGGIINAALCIQNALIFQKNMSKKNNN
ncbi:MAG: S8 family serine peptidase [Sediminibacterium sp.]